MLHTNLPIYKKGYDLLTLASDVQLNMPRTFNTALSRVASIDSADLYETANSYFGLLRQSSKSHHDRAALANALRRRGHSIKNDLTKTYRRKAA